MNKTKVSLEELEASLSNNHNYIAELQSDIDSLAQEDEEQAVANMIGAVEHIPCKKLKQKRLDLEAARYRTGIIEKSIYKVTEELRKFSIQFMRKKSPKQTSKPLP